MFLSRLVGDTPLVRISDKIFAKLETYNPSGSVKDRMVCYVVEKALDAGDIGQSTCLIEATSGNTGDSSVNGGSIFGPGYHYYNA